MRRGLILGILGWLGDIVLFRLIGHHVLADDVFLAVYFANGVLCVPLALVLCWLFGEPGKAARFAAGLTIPGLIGGAAAVLAFPVFYPNIPADRADEYAAFMMFGYGIILATILLFGEKVVRRG